MPNITEYPNPQQATKSRLGDDFDTTLTVNADKHMEIAAEANRLLEVEEKLNSLLDRISGNQLIDEKINDKLIPHPKPIPTLISVLNETPQILQGHRQVCLDKLCELEDKLFGNVR